MFKKHVPQAQNKKTVASVYVNIFADCESVREAYANQFL